MRSQEVKMRGSRRIVSASAALALLGASAPAFATAPGMGFAPHRAVYEMQLDETAASQNIAGVEGRMVFEIAGSTCTGYTLNNRMVTRIVDAEGTEVVSDIRSSTWEDGEGEQFRFTSSQYLNDRLTEELDGRAVRSEENGAIKVTLDDADKTELRISDNPQFPTQFSLKILEAAKAGKRVLQANLYDGSESGDKLFATTTFIGERIAPGEQTDPDIPGHETLKSLPSWPVSISYFEHGAGSDSVPSYQLSFRLYENGVSRKLRIDYGTFALTGRLSSLAFQEVEHCPQKPG